ncbi:unnamed protein product [Urochloa decumbens]|uniref:Uncharacterized protein n=1 Tax=Urochloa decumbens TaxID=240449 RepID=A0ABC8W124_9POAL
MAGSMETGVTVLLALMVGMFGVTSAVLGFIAESKRVTPRDIHVSGNECVYPASPAHTLGVCAMLLLMAAQIIASVAGGCCGCCRPGGGASKSKRRVVGVVASVLSWIVTAIAGWYYGQGVYWNTAGTRRASLSGAYEECFYLKGGVFVRAAVLSIIATSLAIMSCFLLRAPAATPEPAEDDAEPKPDGVAVGLPQWPAQGNGHAPYQQQVQIT